jgi:hypothetical protein
MIKIENVVVGSDEWVPIVCTIGSDYFAIWNVPNGWMGHGSANVILCSDPNDPNSQKPLANGAQEVVAATAPKDVLRDGSIRHLRFLPGDVLYYAKAVSGDTVLCLTCLF